MIDPEEVPKIAKPTEAPSVPVVVCQTLEQFMVAPAPSLTPEQREYIKKQLQKKPCPFFPVD